MPPRRADKLTPREAQILKLALDEIVDRDRFDWDAIEYLRDIVKLLDAETADMLNEAEAQVDDELTLVWARRARRRAYELSGLKVKE